MTEDITDRNMDGTTDTSEGASTYLDCNFMSKIMSTISTLYGRGRGKTFDSCTTIIGGALTLPTSSCKPKKTNKKTAYAAAVQLNSNTTI